MQPMRDLIVIKMNLQPKEEKRGGLLFQAPKWAKPSSMGEILQVGPEVKGVEIGDVYLINPYSVIDTEDKEIKIIRESDVLCRVTNNSNQ